jgi:hypothetical protein
LKNVIYRGDTGFFDALIRGRAYDVLEENDTQYRVPNEQGGTSWTQKTKFEVSRNCCITMTEKVNYVCDDHGDGPCPDYTVRYNPKLDSYGLPIYGEPAQISIQFCPWCGSKLSNRSDEWFDKLEAIGINPFMDTVPAPYDTDAWYKEDKA